MSAINRDEFPLPEITALNNPYWDGIAEGYLQFQRCHHCNYVNLPPRGHCTHCLNEQLDWEKASGKGKLISWIIYHKAFHPAFEKKLPYIVAVIELDEGPRMVSNLVGIECYEKLTIDSAVELVIEHENDFALPRFRLIK